MIPHISMHAPFNLLQFIKDVRMDYRISVILTMFKNQVTSRHNGDILDDESPALTPPLTESVLNYLLWCNIICVTG